MNINNSSFTSQTYTNQDKNIILTKYLNLSKEIANDNKNIEYSIIKLKAYIFSSKIRAIIFNTFNTDKTRETIFLDIIQKVNEIKWKILEYQKNIKIYYNDIDISEKIFTQNKHYILSKKYIYNSLYNTNLIDEKLANIIKSLENLKIIQNPDENQKNFQLIQREFEIILKLLKENHVSLSDIQGRVQVEENLVSEYKEIKKFLIDKNKIQTGDIFMSFKSKSFLKSNLLGKIISNITDSQITHAAMAAKGSFGIKIIDSNEDLERRKKGLKIGVRIRDLEIRDGEIFIVLRPKISDIQRIKLLESIQKYLELKTQYSIHKLVGAGLTLLISNSINFFTLGHLNIKNIMNHKKTEMFCSEFVNQVFKEAGILLTPKSQISNTIYPHDIIVSPYIEYIGLIFNENSNSEKIITEYLTNIKI